MYMINFQMGNIDEYCSLTENIVLSHTVITTILVNKLDSIMHIMIRHSIWKKTFSMAAVRCGYKWMNDRYLKSSNVMHLFYRYVLEFYQISILILLKLLITILNMYAFVVVCILYNGEYFPACSDGRFDALFYIYI